MATITIHCSVAGLDHSPSCCASGRDREDAVSRRCSKGHRVLQVEEFSPLGAHVVCLDCDGAFHLHEPYMEDYTPFIHNSPKGPEGDMQLLVLDSYLNLEE